VLPRFIDNHVHFMDGAATDRTKTGLTNIPKTIRYFYSVRTATWA
jgi:predicted amidohydrolase YtcJ